MSLRPTLTFLLNALIWLVYEESLRRIQLQDVPIVCHPSPSCSVVGLLLMNAVIFFISFPFAFIALFQTHETCRDQKENTIIYSKSKTKSIHGIMMSTYYYYHYSTYYFDRISYTSLPLALEENVSPIGLITFWIGSAGDIFSTSAQKIPPGYRGVISTPNYFCNRS